MTENPYLEHTKIVVSDITEDDDNEIQNEDDVTVLDPNLKLKKRREKAFQFDEGKFIRQEEQMKQQQLWRKMRLTNKDLLKNSKDN